MTDFAGEWDWVVICNKYSFTLEHRKFSGELGKGQYTGINSQRDMRDIVTANEPGPVPKGSRTWLQLT